ncbi:MAG: aldehyde dehydrogenase family protein [Phycisphaerales bacterium]
MSSPAAMPLYLAGAPTVSGAVIETPDRYQGGVASVASRADAGMIDAAIAAACEAADACRLRPIHERMASLRRIADEIDRRAETLAQMIVAETGKPIREARAEAARAAETFRSAADAASHALHGEALRLDASQRGTGRRAISQRVPIGPLAFITPFNFPLNLVAHKIGPAIAAGCPWVLKPSDKTPGTALMLGDILTRASLPAGSWSILPAWVDDARALVTDERLALLSFTGSASVGWALKSACGSKRIVLELGGDATAIVEPSADLEHVTARVCVGGFSNAGQSCISVQHVLAHRSIYDELRARLVEAVAAIPFGDPRDERTAVGPVINLAAAQRVERWIGDAAADGARVLCGGLRHGGQNSAVLAPTLVENIPQGCALACEEVFGPVVCLGVYDRLGDALDRVNAGRFGLQCGLFTRDLHDALAAWDRLRVGAVVVNDVPTFRTESMPYGGVKQSGLGREGAVRSIHEFTDERLLILDSHDPRGSGTR